MVKLVNFRATTILPNPDEVMYWVDLVADPLGGIIKTWDPETGTWIVIKVISQDENIAELWDEVKEIQHTIEIPVDWNDLSGKPVFAVVSYSGSYNDLTDKPLIPTFIGYATEEWVSELLLKKQNKLTAGTGVSIVDNVINCTLDTTLYQVVLTLPTSNINPNKIYLVLDSDGIAPNIYEEYMYVNNKWELLGEYTASVDLRPYLLKTDAEATYQIKGNYALKSDIPNLAPYATLGYVDGNFARTTLLTSYALKSDIPTFTSQLTNDAAFVNMAQHQSGLAAKADKTALPSKTSLLTNDSGFITGFTEADPTVPAYVKSIKQTDIDGWNNKSTFSGNYNDLTNKPTIPDTSGLVTKTDWLANNTTVNSQIAGKQDFLVSGSNIKTINGYSMLGTGNIVITTEGGGIEDAPTNGKKYGRKDSVWTVINEFSGNYADLTNKPSSLPASDVYEWAKAASKPSYAYSEISGKPTFATVATSGSYNDLSNKPSFLPLTGGTINGDLITTGLITAQTTIHAKLIHSNLDMPVQDSWLDTLNSGSCKFYSDNMGMNVNDVNRILGWQDTIAGQGYVTSYTIASRRRANKFGELLFTIGTSDLNTTGVQFRLAGDGTAEWTGSSVICTNFIGTATNATKVNNKLKLTGAVTAEYDGSSAVTVTIPTIAGAQGPKGDKGDTGALGPIGLTGPTGPKGDTGATGAAGTNGKDGAQGPQGIQGPKGDQGILGVAGATGAKGDTGLTGATGPTGPLGPKGDPGTNGATGATGPKGDKGDTGALGIQGILGVKGDKGDKGDTGSQGPLGILGIAGPQGIPGKDGSSAMKVLTTPELFLYGNPYGVTLNAEDVAILKSLYGGGYATTLLYYKGEVLGSDKGLFRVNASCTKFNDVFDPDYEIYLSITSDAGLPIYVYVNSHNGNSFESSIPEVNYALWRTVGNITTNGYEKFNDGLVIQWGRYNTDNVESGTITLPVAFVLGSQSVIMATPFEGNPTYNYSVTITNVNYINFNWLKRLISPSNIGAGNIGFHWIAIGKWK